jgi:uncharacterized membrane protein
MPSANLPTRRLFSPARILFLALIAATLTQMVWYYPRLPARVASHFDAAGQVNAFMPKDAFFVIQLVVLGIMSGVFLLVPALIVRLPPGMINLPNKEYWLAPERRARTAQTLQSFLVGFGNVMLLFLLLVFREAMHANLLPYPHLSNRIWVLLILLAAWCIYWTVRLVRAFRLPVP